MFEGNDIALRNSVMAFITMNPGYPGRAELPESLKVLAFITGMWHGQRAQLCLCDFKTRDSQHKTYRQLAPCSCVHMVVTCGCQSACKIRGEVFTGHSHTVGLAVHRRSEHT